MFPICLNVANLTVFLVGDDRATARRLKLLKEAGAGNEETNGKLFIYSEKPSKELIAEAGDNLILSLPSEEEIKSANVVMVVDIIEEKAAKIAAIARKYNILVNVEDNRKYCDFFFASLIRRGDLLLAVSTNGQSPTLAVKIKDLLANIFTDIWIERLKIIGKTRNNWKDDGLGYNEIKEHTNNFLRDNQWLVEDLCPRERMKINE